ncbi:MAG: hypothetical protein NTW16_01385 [Bacteroidetes bacterium]|nr:hypothetical protein [Bacteroidota bacterium]
MKSFSNLSHPDLRILWASLVLFKIASETYPLQINPICNLSIIPDLQEDLKYREKVLHRIEQLLHAIEAELPLIPVKLFYGKVYS